jgi:predicted aspartyl protease
MRSSPRTRAVLGAIVLATTISAGHETGARDRLNIYLARNGYCGARLIHPGNFYVLPIRSNGRTGNLLIDTGSPSTLIFRSSLRHLHLVESRTREAVVGVFGKGRDVFGVTKVKALSTGNCTLTNVPVQIAEGAPAKSFRELRPDGLLGLRELINFGAVLDLQNQLLYLRPSRPSAKVGSEIRSILLGEGCTRIPLLHVGNHLLVDGALNGVPCRFIVDTGDYLTMLSPLYVGRANLKLRPTPLIAKGLTGSSAVGMVIFPSLRFGNYEIRNGSATVSRLSPEIFSFSSRIAGLIGIEYLALNYAVFDFTDSVLYVKPRPR